jgi:hypothetical protein
MVAHRWGAAHGSMRLVAVCIVCIPSMCHQGIMALQFLVRGGFVQRVICFAKCVGSDAAVQRPHGAEAYARGSTASHDGRGDERASVLDEAA